jgi:hypothetical protein
MLQCQEALNQLRCIRSCVQLLGKTDAKFVEVSFRLFRDSFGIKTVLSPTNFLEHVSELPIESNIHAYLTV